MPILTAATVILTHLFKQDNIRKVLLTDLGHIKTLITTPKVINRNACGIKFLGTAPKVIFDLIFRLIIYVGAIIINDATVSISG